MTKTLFSLILIHFLKILIMLVAYEVELTYSVMYNISVSTIHFSVLTTSTVVICDHIVVL